MDARAKGSDGEGESAVELIVFGINSIILPLHEQQLAVAAKSQIRVYLYLLVYLVFLRISIFILPFRHLEFRIF
jgi:hypothetical protein